MIEQNRLREQKSLLEGSLTLKDKELQLLKQPVATPPKVTVNQLYHRDQNRRERNFSAGLI